MTWTLVPASRYAEHALAWDALQARTTDTPFLDSAFLQPALALLSDRPVWLALQGDPAAPSAAALVQAAGHGMWQTFQPSQLPLGAWVQSGTDDPIALAGSLLPRLPGLALGLGLTQLDPRLVPRPADGERVRTLDYIDTSWVSIEGDWDAYWNARGKNLRQNTRKQRKKVQAEGLEIVFDELTAPADVAAALADYGRLESTGWKAGGGTAIHPDNDQGRFYRAMLESFAAQGRARMVRCRFGNEVVSMDLCICSGPMVVILKTAYDERHKAVSPSTLMREDEFARWWAEGRLKRIEFYGKTLEWHTRWSGQQRRLYHATVYRFGAIKALHLRWKDRQADREGRRQMTEQQSDAESSAVTDANQ
jgi:CelD/BcsL family acetyltransferase involved in cellulose biosynthesis